MKKVLLWGLAIFVLLTILGGIFGERRPASLRETIDTKQSSTPAMDHDKAVDLVLATMTKRSWPRSQFYTGPLNGGTAVYVADGAYWIKDGTVYIANGFALTWSPNAPRVQPNLGIDIDSVKAATGQ